MSTELIINKADDGCRIALLKDRELVEYHLDDGESQFTVGDIYLGVVKKVIPGLNAAFVDLGYKKDAFLHYHDLGPQYKSLSKFLRINQTRKGGKHLAVQDFRREADIDKMGKMPSVISKGHNVLVQIIKEPISTKGPRLSTELSLAGRYLVLVPFSDVVSVSKKITSSDERKRLHRLISSIKPDNFGVIIRTVAQGKDVRELDSDLSALVENWDQGIAKLQKAKPRDKIIGELNRTNSILRDVLNESFDNVVVDDKDMLKDTQALLQRIAPEKQKIAKLHTGKAKIFEAFGIEKQIKLLFGQTVSVRGGGYLVVEHTEAMHVVDVNSGNKSAEEKDQETTAFNTNIAAAKEIARQLRLRDMGGIIVVDFIDMRKADHKKELYSVMRKELENDRSKATVLPLSKFGLMQITRQRVRPEVNITTRESCPSCNGTGKVTSTIGVAVQLENELKTIMQSGRYKKVTISLHPYLYAYMTKGLFSRRVDWFFKYGKWVKLIEDSSCALNEFNLLDEHGEDIRMEA